MNTEYQDLMPVMRAQVIHPTLNEVLVRAFSELERPTITPIADGSIVQGSGK
jgi:hypothetical protein